MTTKADVVAVGQHIYDQGTTDLATLTAAIARTVGVGGALYAAVAAKQIIDGAAKKVAGVVTGPAGAVADAAGVFRDAVELPTRVLRWLSEPGTWIRIAYIFVGAGAIFISVRLITDGAAASSVGTVAKAAAKASK